MKLQVEIRPLHAFCFHVCVWCVTCCVDYIRGRMYIGKYMNTKVKESNLRGSENE